MVSAREIDENLSGVEEPERGTLEALRRTILEIVPDAEQVISFRAPAFRVGGQTVAGYPGLIHPDEAASDEAQRAATPADGF